MRNRFVEDGYKRARAALRPALHAEVEAEYAVQLQEVGFLERMKLKREISREVARRLHKQAPPPDALY
jgi:hypothetical protein